MCMCVCLCSALGPTPRFTLPLAPKLPLQGAVRHLGRQLAAHSSDWCVCVSVCVCVCAAQLLYHTWPSPDTGCAPACCHVCARVLALLGSRRCLRLCHSSASHLSPLGSSALFVVVHTFARPTPLDELPHPALPLLISLSVFASSSLHQSSRGKNHPGNSFPSALLLLLLLPPASPLPL